MPELHFPVAGAAHLDALADIFLEAVSSDDDGFLIHAIPDDDSCQVGILPLEGRAAADALFGAVVPDEWTVLGAASKGWTRPHLGGGLSGERQDRADVVVLVSRQAEVVARMRRAGHSEVLTSVPAYGAVLDNLQRALGLETAPPLSSAGHFFAAMWLEFVATAQRNRQRPLTWREVGRLHPASLMLNSDDEVYTGDLVPAAKALERVCDWERLRWMVIEGRWSVTHLSPTEAAWLDEGSFSRWVLGQRVPLPALLDDVSRLITPAMAERCARTLRKMGLLTRGQWRPMAA
jgi:hypothetical protein